MEQAGIPIAVGPADAARDLGGDGHPQLALYDDIRALLAGTGLAPEPPTYELFWLYVTGADAALSRELARALDEGRLDPGRVQALRQAHLGEVAASEIQALVEAAQVGAEALARRLTQALGDVRSYDATIAEEDAALALSLTARELADLVQRLRRANATMMAANRRLESEIRAATLETGRLLDRLDSAERVARTDPLTGLLNRRGLAEALKRAGQAAQTAGAPLSVALVDIDHFKRVNDQWGHAIGDEVLRCVAAHLAGQARKASGEGALAGRYGGEEFLVAYPGLPLAEAAAATDTARAILARQVLRRADDGASLGHVSFSAGVAMLRADEPVEALVDRADAALYAAKRAGRDRVLPERPAG